MKNPYSIFTRSRMGLDNQVWLFMLIVLIASLLFFGFKAITHVKCTPFEISVAGVRQHSNNIFFVGEAITFSVPAPSSDQVVWNFDDGTALQKGGKITQHSFFKEGNFIITCILNNKCEQMFAVNIIATPPKKPIIDTASFTADPIIGMDTTRVGDKTHYITTIKANYSYQWNAESSPDIPVQTTAGADFTFYKEGPQILALKIDGAKSYTKMITVLPKKSLGRNPGSENDPIPTQVKIPPVISFIDPANGGPGTSVTINGSFFTGAKSVSFGGRPAKIISVSSTQIIAEVSKDGASGAVVVITENGSFTFANPPFTYIAPKDVVVDKTPPVAERSTIVGITDVQLKKMLQQVINNSLHAPDFERYFCSGVNTKVYVNKDKAPVTFAQLCEKHLQGKKVEIQSTHIVRDPDNPDCETNLVVKYKKKGFPIF